MNEDLEQRVELMKREIDALQVTVTERSKPWYHNVSVLISIIALLFSFGTTLVSYHRNNIQEIQNARAELRGLLQRMAALPKENVEIGVKYANDPAVLAEWTSASHTERAPRSAPAAPPPPQPPA